MLKQRQVLTLLPSLVQKVQILTGEARLVAGVAYAALPQSGGALR